MFVRATALKSMITALIFTCAAMLGTATFFMIGPRLEERLNPVIGDVVVTQVKGTLEQQFIVSGRKSRGCPFVEIDALVMVDGKWQRGLVDRVDGLKPQTTPEGYQVFGVYRITPHGTRVHFEMRHNCHLLWLSATDFGDHPIESPAL
jgi:hypothetical protein